MIKFIQLKTEKERSTVRQQHQEEQKDLNKKDQNSITPKKIIPTSTKTILQKKPDTNKYQQTIPTNRIEKIENYFNIVHYPTDFRGGFLTAKIPGNNRKEQIDYITELLRLDSDNNLISYIFHEGNSWLTMNFNSLEDLQECINDIENQEKSVVKMIILSKSLNKNRSNQLKDSYINKSTTISNSNQVQTYRIIDIPHDLSKNRIRGALKPFGNLTNLKEIQNKGNVQGKEIQVTIESTLYSKDLSNRWSIPIGSTMARIALDETCPEIWKNRNQYTARLYGIPKAINMVLLMRSIKNLKYKTCYISRCSILVIRVVKKISN